MLTPKFLLFYPRTSNYWPATDGEFKVTPEFGANYVYKGRLLSIQELNALDAEFWNPENHRSPVQVRCRMVDDEEEAKKAEEEAKAKAEAKAQAQAEADEQAEADAQAQAEAEQGDQSDPTDLTDQDPGAPAEESEAPTEDPFAEPADQSATEPETFDEAPQVVTPRESLADHLSKLPNKGTLLEFATARNVTVDMKSNREEMETTILEALYPAEK